MRAIARSLTASRSATAGADALGRRRVSVIARMRFHPQNNYVGVPPADIALQGTRPALIGVLREPVLALPSGRARTSDRPILGALVEGVFEAVALRAGRARVRRSALESKELARVSFDLGALQ